MSERKKVAACITDIIAGQIAIRDALSAMMKNDEVKKLEALIAVSDCIIKGLESLEILVEELEKNER